MTFLVCVTVYSFIPFCRSFEKHYFHYICVNIVKGHHHQLMAWPPVFCNFQWFSIKAVVANHPVIQMEVQELLAKGAIESSTSDAGFYSNVFVVPKHSGDL